MDRTVIAPLEQMRDFDYVEGNHDILYALGYVEQDVTNGGITVVAGLAATQTTVASLTVNVAAGRIYQQAYADATSDGSIPQDLTIIQQQGINPGQTLTLIAPSTVGQSQWNLVQAQFSQADSVRANDPNGGIVPFYNISNPNSPIPTSVNTVRQGLCVLQVVQGTAATTGSETPPSATAGWTPLYLIDLAHGQTQITNAEILTAGPSVGTNVPSNYAYAPFLAGLLQSHHSGNPGQAPKVNLASEVQGQLPLANMVPQPTGSVDLASSGTWTVPANVYSVRVMEVWGSSSGSGGGATSNVGGGGGGAAYSRKTGVAVTPGNVYTFTSGAAGAAGSVGGNGTAGGTTTLTGTGVAISVPTSNVGVGSGSGGAGGAGAVAGTGGTYNYAGGNGGNGVVNGTLYLGGSGGTSPFGGSATSTTVGTGWPPNFPGGGPGGGANNSPGVAGLAGFCRISW